MAFHWFPLEAIHSSCVEMNLFAIRSLLFAFSLSTSSICNLQSEICNALKAYLHRFSLDLWRFELK